MAEYILLTTALAMAAAQPIAAAWPVTGQHVASSTAKARHEICRSLATGGSYLALNLADCLSYDNAPEAVFKTQVCTFLNESEQLQDYGFVSYADCTAQRLIR